LNLTVFAGTFNPIHTAHLIIAEFIREELKTDKILFVPSFMPPHKNNDVVDVEHRYNMVKLAVQNNPFFEISDIEIKLGGISYTYNTICELYRQNPDLKDKINFIIGADALSEIETWYKPDELAKLIKFIVISRPENKTIQEIIANINLNNFSYQFIEAPEISISSSCVRERIKAGKSIKYLVPEVVEKYIKENGLYE